MKKKTLALLLLMLSLNNAPLAAGTENVVVSIKPLHSLVQGVMGNTGQAKLLIRGNTSLHGFHFKPSQIKMLYEAEIIFYIDVALESFLHKVFKALPAHVRKSAMTETAQLIILEQRAGGAWETYEHHGHENEEIHRHDHGRHNLHLWLDPSNAKRMAATIARELSALFPENREIYKQNARALTTRLETLDAALKQNLTGIQNKPFVVFHDAYQYFERRYGLKGIGSITLEPDEVPSVNRIKAIREKIKNSNAVCVFHEPQFSNKLVNLVTQASNARTGTLDPLGAGLENGPNLYFKLLENLATNFRQCLGQM